MAYSIEKNKPAAKKENKDNKPKQNKLLCSAGKKEVIDYHSVTSDIITMR